MNEAVVKSGKSPTDFNKTLCFGSILQTLISGWDEEYCKKVSTRNYLKFKKD